MNQADMDTLSFGTDGWRDLIADKFTFRNVRRAAQGYANSLKSHGGSRVLVGYDTRFLSREFAETVARVLAGNDLEVLVSSDYLPTPVLSFATRHLGADGAVMLTASHNPPQYHGFKVKGSFGGSVSDSTYRNIAEHVRQVVPEDIRWSDDIIQTFDIKSEYYEWLNTLIDVTALRTANETLVHDAMGGAASGWLSGWFEYIGSNIKVVELRADPDPLFYGVNPEPISANLGIAKHFVRDHESLFLTATDGDGDRLGVVLPEGIFFNSHQIFAVLLQHLYSKGLRGNVVKTFTVSRIVDHLAQSLGLEVLETPVGFKYIAEAMNKGEVLIGGEESGGIGVGGHIPERDGILNSLLLVEAVVMSGRSLDSLFSEIQTQTSWKHAYDRVDLHMVDQEQQEGLLSALGDDLNTFEGREVRSVERMDGIKLNFMNGAWLLFRSSGTEPMLRVYCEAATSNEVEAILRDSQSWVTKFNGHR